MTTNPAPFFNELVALLNKHLVKIDERGRFYFALDDEKTYYLPVNLRKDSKNTIDVEANKPLYSFGI